MSCRTTRAGSAFTTYARLAGNNSSNGGYISDVSTLSLFHQLRNEWEGVENQTWIRRNVNREGYLQTLTSARRDVYRDPNLSDARRASIMERLDQAGSEQLDDSTIYALQNLRNRAQSVANKQFNFISTYAEELGIPLAEAQARFVELENSIDRTRGGRDPETFTEENREKARNRGLSKDPGSVHAFTVMEEEIIMTNKARYANRPPRVVQTPLNGQLTEGTRSSSGFKVVSAGHDSRNGHMEVIVEDAQGDRSTKYYKNISTSMWNSMTSGRNNPTQVWEDNLMGRPWNEYNSDIERMKASSAPHCPVCGQFSNTSHTCPVTVAPQVVSYSLRDYSTRTSGQALNFEYTDADGDQQTVSMRIDLPLVSDFRTAANNGAIVLNGVSQYVYAQYGYGSSFDGQQIKGDVGISRDPETNELIINTRSLKCECAEYKETYDCKHLKAYAAAIRTRLTPPQRVPAAALTPEQRAERLAAAQARTEAAAATDWTRSEETLADAKRLWQESEAPSYFNDFSTFEQHYREAESIMANKNGAAAVPYMKENALGGMATRESGQAFGMEIEYEFPPEVNRSEANRKIGEALKAANITATAEQQRYHAAQTAGYKDTHVDPETGLGTWSWESDGSVSGGELVSPGMYDEPETWEKLEQVVKIIKDNGGIATAKAGAHVHVGTGFYQGDIKKYGELAKMMNQHEDVMFRLAQNPEKGEHRQGHYSSPLREAPAGGWSDLSELRRWQSGRTKILNFSHVNAADPSKDHPEFRIFDSTLDAGVMQTQIKLAVAMTHAAARVASDKPTVRAKEQIGAHVERNKGKRKNAPMTSERLQTESTTFRSLVDTLFNREEDKKQITALFAATKWNKPDAANRRMQRNGY